MISRTTKPGTRVWHKVLGFGVLEGFESKIAEYKGFAIVKFDEYHERFLIERKKLTEIEET